MRHAGVITRVFAAAALRNESVLIVYCTAGYPNLHQSMDLVQSCAECGADIIEIGIPFSDPVADGSSIQYSSQQALEQGVTLNSIINALADLNLDVPIIIMSYLNPVLAFGQEHFLRSAARARVSGLIIPDLPVEEATRLSILAKELGVDLVLLAAPTSTPARLQRITKTSQGFVYCVSTTGTTGIRTVIDANTKAFLKRVRAMTDKPCAVGFGISTPEHIRSLRNEVDGIVIGSRIIEGIRNEENIPALIKAMKGATRR
jgi:tryptophan synthase alpha chain